MKKTIVLLALAAILIPTAAMAKISFQFKSIKVNINSLPVTLNSPITIRDGIGIMPVRLLLNESGHELITGKSEFDPLLQNTIGINKVSQGFNYFKNPCFISDGKGKVIATIGIDSDKIFIGDNPITTLSTKATLEKGVLFVPIKDFCNLLGLQFTKEKDMLSISKVLKTEKPKSWADRLLEYVNLETLLYICFGIVVFCLAMLILLTPLRRVR
jgi:hypothetical protein